ncbi:MAG: hypothetical protein DI626_06435 [Micavibrio aeruginosavorus]|uniref:Serine aminopeptidase S33 domain-containing protein n=1 Tax=Micavibrio aeruginosavorus TaxID=349221 RepID=A0A2W5BTG4_9BACT|nr:MAG: hypothetical protein DI626_06435 [Micavibrio aeruginosavorus]
MQRERVTIGRDENSGSFDARMSADIFQPDKKSHSRKVAFVFHGRNGASDAEHMIKVIAAYTRCGYLVVAPNLCNSEWNGSAGQGTEFTMHNHVRDSRRSIEWAISEKNHFGWDGRSFALCGHSMGGYAALFLAATDYRGTADHVLAVAPAISGECLIDARRKYHPNGIENMLIETPSALAEWPRHDLFNVVAGLTMPVSAVVGVDDNLTLPSDIGRFFSALPKGQEFEVLDGEHHCLVGENIPDILARKIGRLEAAARSAEPVMAFSRGPVI